jgi:hypothetical protein
MNDPRKKNDPGKFPTGCQWAYAFFGLHFVARHCILWPQLRTKNGKCLLICLLSDFNSLFKHNSTVLARQVMIQSSSSGRARSKTVMNQTMFDVPDPLVVHVLLAPHT